YIAWFSDGSGLLINGYSEAEALSQISYLSKDGEAQRITNDLNGYYGLSLTADSGSMVTVQWVQNSNIWIAPGGDASRARQITSGASYYARIQWTPDGKIVYASGSIQQEIWVMEADGSGQKQLTFTGHNRFPSVCGDGRHIVFTSNRTGANHIWRMDADGGNQRQLTGGDGDFSPACSPDGKWVVYASASTGRRTLWKVSIDGGTPTQLTNYYAELPVIISPDGKWIATRYREEGTSKMAVAIIPFEGGPPVKTFDSLGFSIRWSPDGRALTYRKGRGVANIWSQPVDGGPPKQITDFKSDYIFSFDWSLDGKLLALSRGNTINDVVLISNFK
ncbi:MAG: DPP IV N-terminal domain-containing protein, partial [Acidobacteria bacterium]|nr:DPP IV N-terminal domain-containing protein [Acidobacteriota bacterium]